MKQSRLSEAQVFGALREQEARAATAAQASMSRTRPRSAPFSAKAEKDRPFDDHRLADDEAN